MNLFRQAVRRGAVAILALLLWPAIAGADIPAQVATPGSMGWPYPASVSFFALQVEHQDVRMAYMDFAPTVFPNGRTVVLLHGKNFGGAYWRDVAQHLTARGYHVVVPDQIGFGRSSRPLLRYSFAMLETSTLALLDQLGIARFAVVGHSTGGMLAMHLAIDHPERVEAVALEDPIGLEDYQKVEPELSLDAWYLNQLNATDDSVRTLFHNYFVHWQPQYDHDLLEPALQDLHNGEYPQLAMVSALTYLMILEEPVAGELHRLTVPALIVYGDADRTAIGKANASPEVRDKLGDFQALANAAVAAMPHAHAVAIHDAGHIPHLEQPQAFFAALDPFLKSD